MRRLLFAAAVAASALASGLAYAEQPPEGSGRGDCDRYRGPTPTRPDCLGYNPFYTGPGAIGPTGAIGVESAPRRVIRQR